MNEDEIEHAIASVEGQYADYERYLNSAYDPYVRYDLKLRMVRLKKKSEQLYARLLELCEGSKK